MTIDEALNPFRADVERLAAIISAPASLLPTYGRTEDGARPHIEFASGQYHYVVVERGQELERTSSPNPTEILYRVFDGVTSAMAGQLAGRHRVPGEDFRRMMFDLHLDLLGRLSPEWQSRTRLKIEEILRRHPFED